MTLILCFIWSLRLAEVDQVVEAFSSDSAASPLPSLAWYGTLTVDFKKLEYWPGTMYASFPSSLWFGVGGRSYPTLWLLL